MGSPDGKIGDVFLDMKTVQVSGGKGIKMTVRNMFYLGFIGKFKTIYYWLRYNRNLAFKEYLNTPVKYVIEDFEMHAYHDINAEAELTKLLAEQTNENEKKD